MSSKTKVASCACYATRIKRHMSKKLPNYEHKIINGRLQIVNSKYYTQHVKLRAMTHLQLTLNIDPKLENQENYNDNSNL